MWSRIRKFIAEAEFKTLGRICMAGGLVVAVVLSIIFYPTLATMISGLLGWGVFVLALVCFAMGCGGFSYFLKNDPEKFAIVKREMGKAQEPFVVKRTEGQPLFNHRNLVWALIFFFAAILIGPETPATWLDWAMRFFAPAAATVVYFISDLRNPPEKQKRVRKGAWPIWYVRLLLLVPLVIAALLTGSFLTMLLVLIGALFWTVWILPLGNLSANAVNKVVRSQIGTGLMAMIVFWSFSLFMLFLAIQGS